MAFPLKSMIGSAALTMSVALFAPAGEAHAATGPCTGPSPVAGVEIRGPVLHVIDGRTLCVALGFEPDTWIPLRLVEAPAGSPLLKTSTGADTGAPRGLLMEAAFAKMAVCRTLKDDDGVVVAACEIEGKPLSRALSDPKVVAASYGWR